MLRVFLLWSSRWWCLFVYFQRWPPAFCFGVGCLVFVLLVVVWGFRLGGRVGVKGEVLLFAQAGCWLWFYFDFVASFLLDAERDEHFWPERGKRR